MSGRSNTKHISRYERFWMKIWNKYQRFTGLLMCVYMIAVMIIIPFYHKEGYIMIATSKQEFFMKVCRYILPFLIAEGIGLLLLFLTGKRKLDWKKLSVTDRFVLAYGAAIFLSFLFTEYRDEALWGAAGWRMGFVPQIMFIVSFLKIAHSDGEWQWILIPVIPASFLQYLFAVMNRYGYFPIPMEEAIAGNLFIGFVGNINWYCGYMVTILFGVVFTYCFAELKHKWYKWVLAVYLVMGFSSLVTQGSDGGLMTLGGVLYVFVLLIILCMEKIGSFLEILLLLFGGCSVATVINWRFPGALTFPDGVSDLLTASIFPWMMIAVIGSLRLLLTIPRVEAIVNRISIQKNHKILRKFVLAIVAFTAAVGVTVVTMILVNTCYPGSIGKLSGHSFFTFNDNWGSQRGATWMAGIRVIGEQGILKRFVGIGPDCMDIYTTADADPSLQQWIKAFFGGQRLTNAHNEWITILVNTGILGAAGYIGLVCTACWRYICCGIKKKDMYSWIAGACGMSILAYTINNMFSFQQICNVPLMFIIMGAGEFYWKKSQAAPAVLKLK